VLNATRWVSQRSSVIPPINFSSPEHPIAQLTKKAEKQWTELLGKQSQTLGEAYTEYRRRYGRKPPKGFDHWWADSKPLLNYTDARYKWSTERGLKLVDGEASVRVYS
jgi:hypothetical protein